MCVTCTSRVYKKKKQVRPKGKRGGVSYIPAAATNTLQPVRWIQWITFRPGFGVVFSSAATPPLFVLTADSNTTMRQVHAYMCMCIERREITVYSLLLLPQCRLFIGLFMYLCMLYETSRERGSLLDYCLSTIPYVRISYEFVWKPSIFFFDDFLFFTILFELLKFNFICRIWL